MAILRGPGSGAAPPVDVRGSTGVQVGERNTQIIYSYNGLTFGDGVAPPPLVAFSGQVDSPYRGLAAFGEQDAAFFFGRDASAGDVLERMAQRCRDGGVLVVSGVSGSGKSSLLNAGVLPRLRGAGLTGHPGSSTWPCLVFTPAARPLDDLAVRLATLCDVAAPSVRRELERDPASFALLARQAALVQRKAAAGQAGAATDPPRLVLIVDQFEQVFTQCHDEGQRRSFVAALASAATDQQSPVGLVVIGVRADFEALCAEQPELVDAVQRRYLVTAMTERQLRMAITEPARTAGSEVEADLVESLLHDVRGSAGATTTASAARATRATAAGVLPLVSHALDRAWRNRTGEHLTLADYERSGGVEGAVAASAQQAYDALTPDQQGLARQVFLRLTVTSAEGVNTADRVPVATLLEGRDEVQQRNVRAVLDAFVAERLLTVAADTVEISHEALFSAWPLLRDSWLADAQADRIVRARLDATVGDWAAHEQDGSYLYSGSLLEAAVAVAARIQQDPARHAPLAAAERSFLDASVRAAQRRTRRRRTFVAALLALVLALGVSTVLATVAQHNAGRQRDLARASATVATARQLASTATSELDSDLGQAMLLAATSWDLDHGTDERNALWQTATASPHLVRFVPLGATADSMSVSSDGSVIVVGDTHGRVTLMSSTGRYLRVVPALHKPVTAVATADHGTRVMASDGRNVVSVSGGRVTSVARSAQSVSTVGVSSDGTQESFVEVSRDFPSRSTVHSFTAGSPAPSGPSRTFTAAIDSVALHQGELTTLDGSYGSWSRLPYDLTGVPVHGSAGFGAHNYAVALAPDGSAFSYTNSAPSVPVWHTQASAQQYQTPGSSGREPGVVPQALALSAGGKRMAVADSGSIYVSSVHAGRPAAGAPYLATLTGLSRQTITHLAFAGSPDRLVSTSGDEVALWDLHQFSRVAISQPSHVGTSCVACRGSVVSVSSGSRVAYVAQGFTDPAIHDFATGRELRWRADALTSFGPQLWSPGSRTVLQAFANGTIGVIDAASGHLDATWPARSSGKGLVYLHWADHGRRLLSVDSTGTTAWRDGRTGRILGTMPPRRAPGQTGPFQPAGESISADGHYLAMIEGRHVTVTDLRSRRVIATFTEPKADEMSLQFAARHRLFVFRSGVAEVYQATLRRRTAILHLSRSLELPVVDPSGSMLAYQKLSGQVALVDVRSGREVGGFALPASVEARKSGYGFSPDGKDLVVVTEGIGPQGHIVRWHVSAAALHAAACRAAGRRLSAGELRGLSLQHIASACRGSTAR